MKPNDSLEQYPLVTEIITLSHEGRGVARIKQKATFIENALPGETVTFSYICKHKRFDEAIATEILKPSKERVEPLCQYFGRCGGCDLQHLNHAAQIKYKESALLQQIANIGKTKPKKILAPIESRPWGYRHRARLSVFYNSKDKKINIGFLQKNSHQMVSIDSCPILEKHIGEHIKTLADFLSTLSFKKSLIQIDVTITKDICALGLHHQTPISQADQDQLDIFGNQHHYYFYSAQNKQPSQTFSYDIQEPPTHIAFKPNHFTQINPEVNHKMITQAIALLEPKQEDQIIDLFCGVGNFALPLAHYAGFVVGVEGNDSAIKQAKQNAILNNLSNTEFYTDNLFKLDLKAAWTKKTYNKIIIDPPRAGAKEIMPWIIKQQAERILYISCDTATLARDIKTLCEGGYQLESVGAMDMFPQTQHTEAMALLVRSI